MRFIHAADIHLDSPLRGLGSYEDMPADTLRGASRAAFSQLVDEAVSREVDFMVIAGDLYDGDWKDHNTGIYFARQMGRLDKAGIPVYVLHGNHDAESVMTRRLTLPENVHVFSASRATTFRLDTLRVALHGRSFPQAAVTENLVSGYPDPIPGYFNIGVLHTALEGYAQHANYAPCTLEQLHAKGYQYWALGHVHEFQVFPGPVPVVFPGNLQGRHIREQGAKGAVIVECSESVVTSIERLEVDVLRWRGLELDVSDCDTQQAIRAKLRRALEAELASAGSERPCVLRVTLTGETSLHGELLAEREPLRAEVVAMMAACAGDRLWLEKLKVATRAPAGRLMPTAGAEDLAALLAEAAADPVFLAEFAEGLQPLLDRARHDVLGQATELQRLREGQACGVLEDAAAALLVRLEKGA